ncbi:cation-translocating P-type ATPase [Leptolyngbya sp. FACHB-17]|uniref:cation-translocating P-type ATPase n=1 Tax=unclassified Leptolyngbya TaxID=2650499 RepID=UPI0016801ADA|nr:cation-translocating P-type ATPase [Leptolyngbya sp. FACHB-17]MBD2081741.1 cation-translocating P-type ATPase [Leptolyngbya sp. FACHB-17]
MSGHSLPSPTTAWHTLDTTQSLSTLKSDVQSGLSEQEAALRLDQYGTNELEESGGRSPWEILIDQFKNVMLLMLIGVALVSGILDLIALTQNNLKPGEVPFKDTIAILAIVVLNGALGYVQESRAEKALAALKQLSSPRVRILRGGRVTEVDSKYLVPGDVMLVEAGVQVAADGRILEAANLQIREAALTGEAEAVNKNAKITVREDAMPADRINMIYQGTEVVNGRGTVVVTGTGMRTELGKIAAQIQGVESEPTPLQKRMDQLSKALVTGALVLVAIVVIGGLIITRDFSKLQNLLQTSLSMAVAVVPEGLPAVITVTLAIGTQRMVRRQALIRKLPAVETLGSVTTICSDKTGTLTQNKMVVQSLHTISSSPKITGEGYAPDGEFLIDGSRVIPADQPELRALLLACTLCNDSILQQEGGQWIIIGDPTEGALLTAAAKAGLERDQWSSKLPRVSEFPFSSDRKRMSVIVKDAAGLLQSETDFLSTPFLMFTKGSPEIVLERCHQIQIGDRVEPITQAQRAQILQRNNELAGNGLRVLGFAYKPLKEVPPETADEASEQGLVWLGLVDMLDAPRPEVREAVKRCRTAGIRPVMITGDHQLTASAIAQDLGISKPGDEVLIGRELEVMSDQELEQNVDRVSVYARVAPEHKLRIVKALQRRGQIAAMTGDGVNDAPALKQADIGIAMGITGTDVSKEASDMVLLDDNFATIVAATEEGRVVYTNIRRFIKYILGSNIGEVITIAASVVLIPAVAATGSVPLTPLQILWMNLVTDGLPALALAVEPAEPNVMNRPPNNPGESIFARGLGTYMIRIGIVLAILAISTMVWAYNYTTTNFGGNLDADRWKTIVFTTLCLAQMGHAIAIRSNNRLTIELNPFTNLYVWGAVILTSILQLLLVYVAPLRAFFGTHYLPFNELMVCVGVSALMFVWIELEKLFFRFYFSQKR